MEYKQEGFLKRFAKAIVDTEDLNTPILVKDNSETDQLIEQLENELKRISEPEEINKLVEKIKLLKLGSQGEKSVLFELQNSFIPIHILHDLRVSHNDLSAQIDFVVLTRKFILIIEVKNYYGNILVNEKDEFIRQVYKGGKLVFHEGFYSPLRQVDRQAKIFELYMRDKGAVSKTPIYSVVVFTNNKTVINTKNASNDSKAKILRLDNLVSYIKQLLKESSPVYFYDNRMKELSTYMKDSHFKLVDEDMDIVEQQLLQETVSEKLSEANEHLSKEDFTIRLNEKLKKLRMDIANKQNMKAYHIFTNKSLEEIIEKQPSNLNELKEIQGFGDVKVSSFGQQIIDLINTERIK